MRKPALWLALLLATAVAQPCLALEDEDVPSSRIGPTIQVPAAPPEEEEDGAWSEYGAAVRNRYLIGLNSFITFPADPVMSTVSPDEEWDELPLSVVTKYPVGLVQGSMLMALRASMGTLDLVLAPVTPFRMLSPEPRFLLFESAEHEEY